MPPNRRSAAAEAANSSPAAGAPAPAAAAPAAAAAAPGVKVPYRIPKKKSDRIRGPPAER